eukprot:Hpha_TRINITY_DN16093_c3_g5::TRINITY_DN16093_c3_g5_i2::g.117031::m.117031
MIWGPLARFSPGGGFPRKIKRINDKAGRQRQKNDKLGRTPHLFHDTSELLVRSSVGVLPPAELVWAVVFTVSPLRRGGAPSLGRDLFGVAVVGSWCCSIERPDPRLSISALPPVTVEKPSLVNASNPLTSLSLAELALRCRNRSYPNSGGGLPNRKHRGRGVRAMSSLDSFLRPLATGVVAANTSTVTAEYLRSLLSVLGSGCVVANSYCCIGSKKLPRLLAPSSPEPPASEPLGFMTGVLQAEEDELGTDPSSPTPQPRPVLRRLHAVGELPFLTTLPRPGLTCSVADPCSFPARCRDAEPRPTGSGSASLNPGTSGGLVTASGETQLTSAGGSLSSILSVSSNDTHSTSSTAMLATGLRTGVQNMSSRSTKARTERAPVRSPSTSAKARSKCKRQ